MDGRLRDNIACDDFWPIYCRLVYNPNSSKMLAEVLRAMFGSVADMFALQDRVVQDNASYAAGELRLIDRGLVLGWDTTLYVNDPEVIALRLEQNADTQYSETVILNLLHSSIAILVNATRLMMFGAHCDSLGLIRSAYEAVTLAEYFTHNPQDVKEWDAAGLLTDLEARRKAIRHFDSSKQVRKWLREKDGEEKNRDRMFYELSTYGHHANPATVGLRLGSPLKGVAVLGFASKGRSEATRLCALHCLHILMYALSTFYEGFTHYLSNSALCDRLNSLTADAEALRQHAPPGLSLIK